MKSIQEILLQRNGINLLLLKLSFQGVAGKLHSPLSRSLSLSIVLHFGTQQSPNSCEYVNIYVVFSIFYSIVVVYPFSVDFLFCLNIGKIRSSLLIISITKTLRTRMFIQKKTKPDAFPLSIRFKLRISKERNLSIENIDRQKIEFCGE